MEIEIRFEWDERKEESNKRKHRISFPLASLVFKDPLVQKDVDGDEHGEVRWKAMGQIGGAIVRVTYTTREEGDHETIRIISARQATRSERRSYEGFS